MRRPAKVVERLTSDTVESALAQVAQAQQVRTETLAPLDAARAAAAAPLDEACVAADADLLRALGELFDLEPRVLRHGHYSCERSPTARCIYDIKEDPYRDDCLVCHDPAERK